MASRPAPWFGCRASRARSRTVDRMVAILAGSGGFFARGALLLQLHKSARIFVECVESKGTDPSKINRRSPRGKRARLIAHGARPPSASSERARAWNAIQTSTWSRELFRMLVWPVI